MKFVVAPHEMDESRIARLMAETKGGALRYTQCTPRTTYGSRQLLILDTVGILASVYSYATWSYIGGFGRRYPQHAGGRDVRLPGGASSSNR